MKRLVILLLLASTASAQVVDWTRLKGIVKKVSYRQNTVTIQNQDGDLFTVKITSDVDIWAGKKAEEKVFLDKVKVGDKIVLTNEEKAPTAKDADAPEPGGVYKPLR